MTTTDIFREDNTEGYTDAQLAELNRRWSERAADVDPDSVEGKFLAEQLLAESTGDKGDFPVENHTIDYADVKLRKFSTRNNYQFGFDLVLAAPARSLAGVELPAGTPCHVQHSGYSYGLGMVVELVVRRAN